MNEHQHNRDEDRDPRVSRAYRAWSDERTPPELDRAILRHAAGEAAAPRASRTAWFRPLAFAATVLLGAVLIYDMQSPTDPPLGLPGTSSDRPAAGEAGDAREAAATAAGANDARLQDAPAAPPTRYKPSGPRATKERALTEEREAVPPSAGDVSRAVAKPESALRRDQLEPQAAPTRPFAVRDGARHCTGEQTADAESWRRCIEALRDAGDTGAAEQESIRFEARFPDRGEADGNE